MFFCLDFSIAFPWPKQEAKKEIKQKNRNRPDVGRLQLAYTTAATKDNGFRSVKKVS